MCSEVQMAMKDVAEVPLCSRQGIGMYDIMYIRLVITSDQPRFMYLG